MKSLKISKSITVRESDALTKYLSDISKTNLLTPEQETELAIRAQKGDSAAREALVRANLRFVVSVAKQYQNRGLTLSDLISEGNIGLLKAVKYFDPTKGFKFISYAVWWIRQQILQAIAEHGRIVRLPVNKLSEYTRLYQTIAELTQDLHRSPTADEISTAMSAKKKDVARLLTLGDSVVSLDAPVNTDESNLRLIDLIANDEFSADKQIDKAEYKQFISDLLDTLEPREAEIVKLYYGVDYCYKFTLDEIGDRLGLTRERVRQIKNKAMRKLKHRVKIIMAY